MSGRSSWTTHTISFNLSEASTAVISFGYGTGSNNYASKNTPTLHVSHLKLTWTSPALVAARVTLGGYIKKATAMNGVLSDATLTTAIATAQSVLDASTSTSEVTSAATTLETAISTALSGATLVSLTNSDFDTNPNLLADGTVGNSDVFYYKDDDSANEAYNYNVSGWTNASVVSGNATFGGTAEYGSTATICSTTPPAADMFGATTGAALALADGWGSSSRYQQVKTDLPAGRYLFYYEAYNQNSATGINSNYFGVSGTAGDFYGTTNSFVYGTNKTFASGEWLATAIEFDVAADADITIGVGMAGEGGSGSNAKLWIDNVLVYRIGDVIVSTSDASTIISSVEALDAAVYNATEKSALASAKSTFEASHTLDNYNALDAALTTAQNSVTVYTALNTAITNVEGWTTDATNVTDPIRLKYTNGTYSDLTTAADIYSEYQAAEIEALVAAGATDYTSAIINPSFETNNMTGWTAESRNDTGVKAQASGTYAITSGDAVDGSYLFNSWGGTAENNVYQTIASLPAGTYTLSALVAGFNGEDLVLAANAVTTTVTVPGDKTVGYTANVVFTLDAAADVVIKASNTKSQSGSDASFIKVDNFRLVKGDITTSDFTALNAAIAAHTLGFETGEYAPYSNISALETLAAAKAVYQGAPMIAADLATIVSNLTGASWTANATDVNAVYNGNFALSTANASSGVDLDIPGWTPNSGIRLVIADGTTYPALSETTGGKALFTWGGTYVYGQQSGYTMPLAAHTIYELSFKHAGWGGANNNFYVKITSDSGDVLPQQTCGQSSAGPQTAGCWDTYRIVFVTDEACDACLQMIPDGNSTFTDIVLRKATNQYLEFADGSVPAYAPGTYPTVKITRTLAAGKWATGIYPFAVSGVDDIAVLDSYDGDDGTMTFVSAAASTANKPFLMRSTSGTSEITLTDVDVAAAETTDETKGDLTFTGKYATTVVGEGVGVKNYVLSDNTIYKIGTNDATINPYRAYFQLADGAAVKSLNFAFEGEATAINVINAADVANGAIYNLQGQQLGGLQRGINIVNGKKVLVK